MASVYFDPAVGGDGSTVTDDANPSTGLANGGHRTRFVPSLAQLVAVCANAVASAASALASKNSATTSASTATTQANLASGYANSAIVASLSLATNFPTSRPTLLLDFANSRRVDPRITFTRASQATCYNEKGLVETFDANVPRIDFDPITLACKGLLIEEARTNLADYSAYNAGTWSNVFPATASLTTGIDDPSGGTGAVRFAANGTGSALFRVAIPSFTPSGSQVHGVSMWVRWVSGSGSPTLDLSDGAPSGSYASQLVLGQWRRVVILGTPTAVAKTAVDIFSNATMTMTLDFWGLQVEAGDFVTSLKTTNGAIGVRSADLATMTGANFSSWFSREEGSVLSRFSLVGAAASGTADIYTLKNGGSTDFVSIRQGTTLPGRDAYCASNSVVTVDTNASATTVGTFYKDALGYKNNDFAVSFNGAAVLTDTSCAFPTTNAIDRLVFGNGWHALFSYYDTRLSNAELQALSTPA